MAPPHHKKKISCLRSGYSRRRAINRKDLYRKGKALQLLRDRIDAILAQNKTISECIGLPRTLLPRRLDPGLLKLEPVNAPHKSPDHIRSITPSLSHQHHELDTSRESTAPPISSPPKNLPGPATSVRDLSRMLQGLQVVTSNTFPFFSLPPELRDQIYVYASVAEGIDTWIGAPPLFEGQKDSIIEKINQSTFVKTSSGIVALNHQARSEFRWAVWRDYMTTKRQIDVRVHDFMPASIKSFFTSCSSLQLERILKPNRCHVRIHLIRNFHKHRGVPRADESVMQALKDWVVFCDGSHLVAEHSLDEFDWYDVMLIRSTLYGDSTRRTRTRREWAAKLAQLPGKSRVWFALCIIVIKAYRDCNIAMERQRKAFHKLAPLGR